MAAARFRPRWLLALLAALVSAPAAAAPEAPAPEPVGYVSAEAARRSAFWWPTVMLERASTHLSGARSIDETRFGLMLAYRTAHFSPHLRALVSPSLGAYQNLAVLAGAGLRMHFDTLGVPLSCGVGLSVEARLRDSLWLAYATPIELGVPLYRGESAEHYLFVGARHSVAGSLINSYLLDPNGYDNEDSQAVLDRMRDGNAWQLYVSLAFGRRVE